MIYFIESQAGPIKIGYTDSSATQRLGDLQTGSAWPLTLLGTIDGDLETEAELHRRFASARMSGEWFRARIRKQVLALILDPMRDGRKSVNSRPISADPEPRPARPSEAVSARLFIAEPYRSADLARQLRPEMAPMNLCSSCGTDFGSVSAFDAHRVGAHAFTYGEGVAMNPIREDGRRCLSPVEMLERGFTKNTHGRWSTSALTEDALAAISAHSEAAAAAAATG